MVDPESGRIASGEERSPLDGWMAAFLCAACAVFMIFAARVENYGSDTTTYLLLARSILKDGSYTFNFAPHTVYPPGYPLVLAGLMALGVDSWTGLIRATIPIYFVGLWGLYQLVRLLDGRRTAAIVTTLSATSHAAFFWNTAGLHSEGVYFACSIGALLWIEAAHRARRRAYQMLFTVFATFAVAFLPLVRTVGVTLLAGLVLWILLPIISRRAAREGSRSFRARRWAPALALGLATAGGWMAWANQNDPGYPGEAYMGSYVGQMIKSDPHRVDSPSISPVELAVRSARVAAIRAQRTTQTILNQPWWDLSFYSPVTLLFLLVLMTGLIASLIAGPRVLEGYSLAYLGIFLFWPFDEGNRFHLPVLPFLYLYVLRGLRTAWALPGILRWKARFATPAVAAGVTALLLVVAAGLYHSVLTGRDIRESDPTTFRIYPTVVAADWIRENTPPDAVIMDEQAAILHRLTGRKTYRFPLLTDPAEIQRLILETGTDYVVVLDERPFEYFTPPVAQRFGATRAAFPELFSVVQQFDFGCICKVQGD